MNICVTEENIEQFGARKGITVELPFMQGLVYVVAGITGSITQTEPVVDETSGCCLPVSWRFGIHPLSGSCESSSIGCCTEMGSIAFPPLVVGTVEGVGFAEKGHFFQQKLFLDGTGAAGFLDGNTEVCLDLTIEQTKMTAAMERQLMERFLGPCPTTPD